MAALARRSPPRGWASATRKRWAALCTSSAALSVFLRLASPAWATASMALSSAAPPVVPSGPWRSPLPGL
eukprot:11887248-Alexandrium_andersonii.AAC.1